ncbi:MAG: hypothetical protein WBN75_12985 [Verrucomicrobiia bacterium]
MIAASKEAKSTKIITVSLVSAIYVTFIATAAVKFHNPKLLLTFAGIMIPRWTGLFTDSDAARRQANQPFHGKHSGIHCRDNSSYAWDQCCLYPSVIHLFRAHGIAGSHVAHSTEKSGPIAAHGMFHWHFYHGRCCHDNRQGYL